MAENEPQPAVTVSGIQTGVASLFLAVPVPAALAPVNDNAFTQIGYMIGASSIHACITNY